MTLNKTKQKKFKYKIFGFDIETANNNKDFVLASIYSENYKRFYYSPEELKSDLQNNKIFRNSVIFATNLSFDFFGTFGSDPCFSLLFRGSDLLSVKTFIVNNKFYFNAQLSSKQKNKLKFIKFLDTMNYAHLSVEKMGKILELPKLIKPDCLGLHPQNNNQLNELKNYNLRDSEISYKFAHFLINSFEKLGATFKDTIASTSMSIFRNKYLDKTYHQQDIDILRDLFLAYYGGRTEAFKRGFIKDYNYYDFNSLYPSVMEQEKYPDPNTFRETFKDTLQYINNYEGVSHVNITIPKCKYPLLPVKTKTKLLFPYGNVTGWYSHIELREALKLGYTINKVYKTYYYLKTCTPFKGFVNDLYNKRNSYKKENNPMEYVVKIVMNSLYGKFVQKFDNKENWVHESTVNYEDIESGKIEILDRIGVFFRIKTNTKPASFIQVIWGIYIASYSRIKLHRAILKSNPVYVDTDSLITKKTLPTGDKLGQLKLEMKVSEGYIIRPKFYGVISDDKELIKIKGLGVRLNYIEFNNFLINPRKEYNKFTKFKEGLRRGFKPNEIIPTHKELSLNDSKRFWKKENMNIHVLEDSEAINI